MNEHIYCDNCESLRNREIKYCPACSTDGKPRYEVKFRSTAGTWYAHDRWLSVDLRVDEIVKLLNDKSPVSPFSDDK